MVDLNDIASGFRHTSDDIVGVGRDRNRQVAIAIGTVAMLAILTFGVSALCTGIAWALGAIVVQFVAADGFTIYMSVAFLVGYTAEHRH